VLRLRQLNFLIILLSIFKLQAVYAQQVVSASALSAEEALEFRGNSFAIRPIAWLSNSYDSNVFYEANPEPTLRKPNSGFVSFLGAGFKLENKQKENVIFLTNFSTAYRHYIYINPNEGVDKNGVTITPISQKAMSGRNTIDNAKLDISARFLPQSTIQFHLSDLLNYIERPMYDSSNTGFQRIDNRIGAKAHFIPGGDKSNGPLDFNVGYGFRNVSFLNADQKNTSIIAANAGDLNSPDLSLAAPIQGRSAKIAHDFAMNTKFRFLPKNYLLLDIKYVINDYERDAFITNANGSVTRQSRDSTPFSALFGISGLITSRIAFFVKAGYGNTYHATGNSYSGFLATTEVSYVYAPRTQVSMGYQRDAQDMGVSNFYVLDRFYLRANHIINSRWVITTNNSFDYYAYDRSNSIDGKTRLDPILRSQILLKQKLFSFYSLGYGFNYEANYTDYQSGFDENGQNPLDFAKYQKFMLTLTFQMN
jgi:hypothetical protein